MKTFTLNIHPELKNVTFSVKNGREFTEKMVKGEYHVFAICPTAESLERIKKFAIKFGNDNSSNRGNWYAHCNGYAMNLMVLNKGQEITINSYRPYGRTEN